MHPASTNYSQQMTEKMQQEILIFERLTTRYCTLIKSAAEIYATSDPELSEALWNWIHWGMEDVNDAFNYFMRKSNPELIRKYDDSGSDAYPQLRKAVEWKTEILTHALIKLRMDTLNVVQVKRSSKSQASFKQGLLDVLIAMGQILNSLKIKLKDKLSFGKQKNINTDIRPSCKFDFDKIDLSAPEQARLPQSERSMFRHYHQQVSKAHNDVKSRLKEKGSLAKLDASSKRLTV